MHGVVTLKNLYIILIYLAVIFGIKKFKKDKLSEIDFKKHKEYYREILKDYSPAELSYIDNFQIVAQRDITSTLLALNLNKKVDLDTSSIKIQIQQQSLDEISNNENYILNSIKDGKINNFDENKFLARVIKDCIKNGLLRESSIEWKKFKKISIVFWISVILLITAGVSLFKDFIVNTTNIEDWKIFVLVFIILLLIYLPSSIIKYFKTYVAKSKKNPYVRTNKGEEINEKLEGIKNYLKDYSVMHERNENSLELWEDYLIYSVIFNQNEKTVDNIYNKYVNI